MNMIMKNLTSVASFFLLALMVDVHAQTTQPAQVWINSGMVRGTFEHGLKDYGGIPFAATSVEKNRGAPFSPFGLCGLVVTGLSQ
jgi:hypothetical protein